MIVDIHTHIFPPSFIERRDELVRREPRFAELYGDPKAKMATAAELLASMQRAGVDVSVACGFWWEDRSLAAEHAVYIVDVAEASGGRIVPFVPSFEAVAGAVGSGEVRLDDPGTFADSPRPLLVHCSEEAGHQYPGKAGGLTPGGVWRLLEAQPHARVIAAHWGGGLPFYALMPEVRAHFDAGRVIVDSAASALLYRPEVFRTAVALAGVTAVAWGSDFPLRSQAGDLDATREAMPDPAMRVAVLGGNAARFLGLGE